MSYSDYRILGLVGEGSFSRVFCAIDRRNCQLVALKELLRQRFATKQFLRELNFLLSLRHPHIVSCQSIEYHAKARYLVTDYCEGGSLRDLLKSERRLSLEEILKLAIDILSGLEYIHNCQVIHGDIKPENILLCLDSRGWIAKIADFGIAKFEREISKGMGLGGTGSPAYMASECFYGKSTQASDLYAVGVILFELLVGSRPFSGTIKELTIAHIAQLPPIPTKLPFLLRSILSKALEKLPYNRFASATEMIKSLRLAMVTLAKEKGSGGKYFCQNIPIVSRCSLKVIEQELLTEAVTAIATKIDWLIENFSLPVAIESLIPSIANPNLILAIENRQQGKGLVIKLKPFQIQRIELELEPDLAIATNWGFFLASDRGEFLMLDLEGKFWGRESRKDLGKILAVSAWGGDRILISSRIDDLYYLSVIEISQTYNSFQEDL